MNTTPPTTITNSLTLEEIEQERNIEEHRTAFLDKKIAMLSKRERRQQMERLRVTANRAFIRVNKQVEEGAIKVAPFEHKLLCDLYVCQTPVLRCPISGRPRWGVADIEENRIGLRDHILLAPTEVAYSLIVHELLHLVYATTIREFTEIHKVRQDVLNEYPEEMHDEEEWVRRMTESICGHDDLLEIWEVAVDVFGDNWRRHFEEVKRVHRLEARKQCQNVALLLS